MIALSPVPGGSRDAVRCYTCGRPGVDYWHAWQQGSRLGLVRFCDPGCRSVFDAFVRSDERIAYEIINGYTLFNLGDVFNQFQFQKWSVKQMATKKKNTAEGVLTAKQAKAKTAQAIEADRKAQAKKTAAELKAALAKAKPLVRAKALTHQQMVGKPYLYKAVSFANNAFGEYAICQCVELSSKTGQPVADEARYLIGATRLVQDLHANADSVPFVATIAQAENSRGQMFYHFKTD